MAPEQAPSTVSEAEPEPEEQGKANTPDVIPHAAEQDDALRREAGQEVDATPPNPREPEAIPFEPFRFPVPPPREEAGDPAAELAQDAPVGPPPPEAETPVTSATGESAAAPDALRDMPPAQDEVVEIPAEPQDFSIAPDDLDTELHDHRRLEAATPAEPEAFPQDQPLGPAETETPLAAEDAARGFASAQEDGAPEPFAVDPHPPASESEAVPAASVAPDVPPPAEEPPQLDDALATDTEAEPTFAAASASEPQQIPAPSEAAPLASAASVAHEAPPAVALPVLAIPTDAVESPPARRDYRGYLLRSFQFAFIAFSGWLIAVLILIGVFRFVNPPFSMLMAQQWLTGTSIDRRWVPLEEISPNLIRAVVVAEDGRFCQHSGIDLIEAAQAMRRRGGDGYPRGASTISMQLTKNLFLFPAKSYLRKAIEIPLTLAIELAWPKSRVLEVYLNIVEWGPGVFGAEAASRSHFRRAAKSITPRQAAQLAAVLPNPIVRNAGSPGPRTARRASLIQSRTARARSVANCVLDGR